MPPFVDESKMKSNGREKNTSGQLRIIVMPTAPSIMISIVDNEISTLQLVALLIF